MRKLLLLISFTMTIGIIFFTATAPVGAYVCGDANDSGGIDIDDVVFLISYIFQGGPAPDPDCCGSDCPPTVTDYDDNVYTTVLIGDQCWMMENLKVTHYRNGDQIPNVTDDLAWSGLSTGAYCDYDNDPGHVWTYGRLYNWYAVNDSRNIAPEGWHVPTDAEWKQLEMYLGMSQTDADDIDWRGTDEGGKLKETGTTHWGFPNTGATNESGFTALPGGHRSSSSNFGFMYGFACFWSSTGNDSDNAWIRTLGHESSQVHRYNDDKQYGLSVRCIRD